MDADAVEDARPAERLPGHLGVPGLELECVKEAALPQRAGEDDAGVPAERPDLHRLARPGGARDHLEMERIHRPDLDLRQPRLQAPLACFLQDRIFGRIDAGEIADQLLVVPA